MTGDYSLDRRNVLKGIGGATALTALGGLGTGSALAGHEKGKAVRVNQIGYRSNGRKIAVVTSGSDLDPTSVSEFEIQDAQSGEAVHSGSLGSAMDDDSSGHTVKHADFSDLTESGEYVLAVDGHKSHPFQVGSESDVYGDLLAKVGRLYTLKRCNTRIDDPVSGLDIGPGHMKDKNAIVAEPQSGDYLSGTGLSAGDTVDVSGGWYDAGDYGKYVTPTAVTIGQMLLAYERHPDIFTTGQFNFPESINDPDVGTMPDLLAEAKKGLEFLDRMQRLDGGLFYIVAGKEWPAMTTTPEGDTQDRYVFGSSSAGTAMACANFAQAARIYEDHDPEFADKMMSNAEAAFSWLQDNPDIVWEQGQGQDSGSGPYTRDGEDVRDRYWAAAEMLRTTGDSKYEDYIQNLPKSERYDGEMVGVTESVGDPGGLTAPIDWNDPVVLGHWAYFKADGKDSSTVMKVIRNIAYALESLHSGGWSEAYGTGLFSYYWGCVKSGVSRGTGGILGYEADQATQGWLDEGRLFDSVEPLHHALGRSATGYSYMSKAGEKSVQHPHDRIVGSTGVLPAGMVVGGPNPDFEAGAGDHLGSDFNASDTPALAYVDEQAEYSVNEWAINYTAPVFLMLAEVVGMGEEAPEPNPQPQPKPTPATPSGLSVSETTSSTVKVSWESVNGATGYNVYVDGEKETMVDAGVTSATISGLSANTDYEIGVSSLGSDSESSKATVAASTDDTGGSEGPTVHVEMGSNQLSSGGSTEASVILSEAPEGLSGYNLAVSVADTSIATVESASYPDVFGLTDDPQVSSDGSSVKLKAVDVQNEIGAGDQNVELATVTIAAQSTGETSVGVAVDTMDDDGGSLVEPITQESTLTVGSSSVSPINGTVPQDNDGDGLYEDLNGNGRLDNDDVVVYFEHSNTGAVTDHTAAYDFNGNGRIDFDDVNTLFDEL